MPISAEPPPLSSEQAATFDQVLRDDPQYREKLDAAVAAGDKRLFAAHFNGKRVAVALIEENRPELDWVVVHPATRGRGVGKDFLRLIGQQLGAILAMPRECDPTR
ncbi:MAG: GNAT family N-acetyltransferase [Alcanivorax sp.]|nr:GNAT family N-acetyltransferase [Alcanivorax sp.]